MFFPDATPGDPGEVVLSASDLRAATGCEHVLLTDLDVRLGRVEGVDRPVDEMLARVAELGDAHEQRTLRRLATEHPGGVVTAPSPERTRAGLEEGMASTLRLMADPRVEVIHQACVFDGRFLGFVDFLVRDAGGAWVVCDAKLARSESVTALLQAGSYAQVLQEATAGDATVRVAPFVRLVLGDDEEADTRLADLLPVVRARRARLEDLVAHHLAKDGPVDWEDPRVERCLRCDVCTAELTERDDVLLVAGVHLDQRAALARAGATTSEELAALDPATRVQGMRPERVARAVAQARLQRSAGEGRPLPFEVHDPGALASIPPPSEGDVFFDFEGDPTYHEVGTDQWGLEYLFGCLTVDGGADPYVSFWAHDRSQEGRALEAFLAWLQDRRRRWPDLHVYHYADYERAALLRLAARHGTGQEVVDGLLRDGVLVDLYDVVKAAVRVGSSSYSIKRLEPLYMGEDLRDPDGVTAGGDSIVEYHRYAQAEVDGQHELARERLEALRDYNEYDCRSTLRLRDWLLARAAETGVPPSPGRAPEDPDQAVEDPHPVEVAVRERLADAPVAGRSADDQALALLGAAVGYSRREDKPHWWGHYDRLETPADRWTLAGDVFVTDEAEVVEAWARPSARGNPRRTLELRGQLNAGRGSAPGKQLVAVYADPPEALRKEGQANGERKVTVLDLTTEVDDDGEEITTLTVEETLPRDAAEYDDLPIGLGPDAPPPAKSIVAAVVATAQAVLDAASPADVPDPAVDLLRRVPPRLTGRSALPQTGDRVVDVRDAVLALDRSYLAVQGPPGTGKTYVGSRVVRDLVRDHGWRVGVVAQSHKAVEHFLDEVVAAGLPGEQAGKAKAETEHPAWTALKGDGHRAFAAGHDEAGVGYVLGGTAWDLTNHKRIEPGQLDLVVVDEAGQYGLVETVAVATAGSRLLLLGDPQQLPPVFQGTHPEPVDRSALGWLLDSQATVPPELGYFLDETWRMHPDLTEAVSHLAYDGRLTSRAEITAARSVEGVAAGLHVLPVDHAERSTASPEEAEAVRDHIRSLVGRAWTDEGRRRPLTAADVLVVTPYNHQVQTVREVLSAAGLAEVEVGTVDRFQGREAPVVLVSMCASSVYDVSRGLGFLLQRNRLNVAISRAQHAAWLVMSPRLVDAVPRSTHQLRALGAFMGLVDRARTVDGAVVHP